MIVFRRNLSYEVDYLFRIFEEYKLASCSSATSHLVALADKTPLARLDLVRIFACFQGPSILDSLCTRGNLRVSVGLAGCSIRNGVLYSISTLMNGWHIPSISTLPRANFKSKQHIAVHTRQHTMFWFKR